MLSIMVDQAEEQGAHPRVAFGARVRDLRRARGMSQERLAEIAGVHRTYVSSVERGQRNVGLDNINALARALEVSPAELFDGKPS